MKVKIGNLFESKCNTIVNTVNCVGVMGKGIALEFKKQYPAMFRDYVNKCDFGEEMLDFFSETTILYRFRRIKRKFFLRNLCEKKKKHNFALVIL